MIFNEIEYHNLVGEKLKGFTEKLQNKFLSENETTLDFTPLSQEAKQKALEISQGLVKEEDVSESIKKEFEIYKEERIALTNKILNGDIKLPMVSKEDLKEVSLSVEEIIEKCTTDLEEYFDTLKQMKNE